MKRLLLATVFACMATAASAGTVKLPKEFLGYWCVADKIDELTALQRDGCNTDEDVVIRQNSIDYDGRKCKLVRSHLLGRGNADTYVMSYRCGRNDWHVDMVMKHGDLFLNTQQGGK